MRQGRCQQRFRLRGEVVHQALKPQFRLAVGGEHIADRALAGADHGVEKLGGARGVGHAPLDHQRVADPAEGEDRGGLLGLLDVRRQIEPDAVRLVGGIDHLRVEPHVGQHRLGLAGDGFGQVVDLLAAREHGAPLAVPLGVLERLRDHDRDQRPGRRRRLGRAAPESGALPGWSSPAWLAPRNRRWEGWRRCWRRVGRPPSPMSRPRWPRTSTTASVLALHSPVIPPSWTTSSLKTYSATL